MGPKRGAGRPPGAKNKKGTKADFANRKCIVKNKNTEAANVIRKCLQIAANARAGASKEDHDPMYNNPVTNAKTGDHNFVDLDNAHHEAGAKGPIDMSKDLLWIPELRKIGFPALNCQIPNKAVQTVIVCFNNSVIHKRIIELELSLTDSRLSAVAHLGFSEWLCVLFEKMKSKPEDFTNLIDIVYNSMQELICNRTEVDDNFEKVFDKTESWLLGNYGEEDKKKGKQKVARKVNPPMPTVTAKEKVTPRLGNRLFSSMALGLEEAPQQEATHTAETVLPPHAELNEEERCVNLNRLDLYNTPMFPMLSPSLVEALGEEQSQNLWESGNLGIRAPISVQAWKYMAEIEESLLENAYKVVERGEYCIEKEKINVPFDTSVFGKECPCPNGLFCNQKNHMANIAKLEGDFLLRKIWRCFCPYFKCACEMPPLCTKCGDNITWFDQGVWAILNNLDTVFPELGSIEAFLTFIGILSNNLQKVVYAYLSYLKYRKTIYNMAIDLGADPKMEVAAKYGSSHMVLVADMMLRPGTYAKNAANTIFNSKNQGFKKQKPSNFATPDSVVARYYPPRMFHRGNRNEERASGSSCSTLNTGTTTTSNSVVEQMNEGDLSVTKANLTTRFTADPKIVDLDDF